MRRFSASGFILLASFVAAIVLTVIRPSPQGLISFGLGEPEVRAAPGRSGQAATKHNLTALDVFNVTLVRIRDAYVDPSRIDPKKMLFEALDSVQFNVPEVLIEASPARDQVVVVVNDQRKTFSTSDVDSPWRLSGKLKKIFRFIESHMNPSAELADVEYAAVNGMLNTLDPHSVLLQPEVAREMDVSTSGKFGGLGIVIRMIKRKLTVVKPMNNTPAERAGIKSGDHIVRIDGEVTENLTLQEAVDRMRGSPKTPITLWIERKGVKNLIRVDLERAIIHVESVESRMLSGNIGYLALKQFSGRTSDETQAAMKSLKAQGAKGWVLDLRSNPGGLLEQAIKVSDLFLDKGTIVTTVGGREREPRRADRKGTDKLPVAVLVNGNSASASEIVAGALKNLDRAVIIGSKTFGKGSVQVLYDNKDGSKLKLTIAQYLTPGDRSIQSLGIVPDIALRRMIVPQKNVGPSDRLRLLPPSRTYREEDLESHLTSRYAKGDDKPTYELSYLYERPRRDGADAGDEGDDEELDELAEDPDADEFVEDFPIKLSRDLIAQIGTRNRTATVQQARRLITRHQQSQHDKLEKALAVLGVDWSEPSRKVGPSPNLEIRVDTDKQRYDAGSVVTITGKATNHGTSPAYQVHGRIKADNPVFEDAELVFGKIAPGETKIWTTRVKVPKSTRDRVDQLAFEFTEARGTKPAAPHVRVRLDAADRPVFAYSHQLLDRGNGDGLLQKGEQYTLRVTIKNAGKGVAAEPSAYLRNASGDGVKLEKARFEMSELKPGESRDVDFAFHVTPRFRDDEVVIEMTVYDSVVHESVVEKLHYKVHGASAGPREASGSVKVSAKSAAIYEGASASSARVATARKGATFAITGKQGSWYRILLDGDRPGFIARANTRKSRAKASPAKALVDRAWQVTPPTIALKIPGYVTDREFYRLSGTATDDTHVEDVYIFVTNYSDKVENRKVFYKSNRKGKRTDALDFTTEIPLWPGTNRVMVVARENDEVRTTHTMYLLREDAAATASAVEKAR